jgi:Uma2 family endonuclease
MASIAAGSRPATVPARFTAEEFLRMADLGLFEGRKVELAGGQIVEDEMPAYDHGWLQARLILLLGAAVPPLTQPVGELSVRISDNTVRDVDAGLVRGVERGARFARPDQVVLAVEIAITTLPTDLHLKAAEYAAAGIPTYWVIDAVAAVTHVLTGPAPGGYGERRVVAFDQPLAVPGSDATIVIDAGAAPAGGAG